MINDLHESQLTLHNAASTSYCYILFNSSMLGFSYLRLKIHVLCLSFTYPEKENARTIPSISETNVVLD